MWGGGGKKRKGDGYEVTKVERRDKRHSTWKGGTPPPI